MKPIYITTLLLFSLVITGFGQTGKQVEPAFKNLIQYSNVRDFTLTGNGEECFFTVQSPLEEVSVIMTMKLVAGKWSEPELLPFSGSCRDLEPFISADGLTLYFVSNRALDGSASIKDYDIWLTKRNEIKSEWGSPVNLGNPVNSKHNEFYPSVAANNNLYFCSDDPSGAGKDDIYFSSFHDHKYSNPVSVGEKINTEGYEYNAFIAPDESFMIFGAYNKEGGLGSGDLYISFKTNDTWDTPVNLGEPINSRAMDYCPFVDLNTYTLYFTSRRSNIQNLVNLKSADDALKEFSKYENGFSRLYKTSFSIQEILKKN